MHDECLRLLLVSCSPLDRGWLRRDQLSAAAFCRWQLTRCCWTIRWMRQFPKPVAVYGGGNHDGVCNRLPQRLGKCDGRDRACHTRHFEALTHSSSPSPPLAACSLLRNLPRCFSDYPRCHQRRTPYSTSHLTPLHTDTCNTSAKSRQQLVSARPATRALLRGSISTRQRRVTE